MGRELLSKHTIWLRPGDMSYLKKNFPAIGASEVIRSRVSALVDELKAASQVTIDPEMLSAANKEST